MPIVINPEIKFASVNATADGVNTIIAAVATKRLAILAYSLTVATAGLILLQDDAGTPVVYGRLQLLAGTPAIFHGGLETPAFIVAAGLAFNISNPAGVDTFGHVAYVEVD